MSATTPNWAISHIASNQNQKEVTANSAFDSLETGVSDYFGIDCAGSADITPASSVLFEFFLDCTGVLTGNIHLILPAAKKLYFVRNSCAGSYTITVRTIASGSPPYDSIVLQQGQSCFLYSDGTNIVRCSALLKSGFDVNATNAPVAAPINSSSSGVAGTWAYNSSYLYVCYATNAWARLAYDSTSF